MNFGGSASDLMKLNASSIVSKSRDAEKQPVFLIQKDSFGCFAEPRITRDQPEQSISIQ